MKRFRKILLLVVTLVLYVLTGCAGFLDTADDAGGAGVSEV